MIHKIFSSKDDRRKALIAFFSLIAMTVLFFFLSKPVWGIFGSPTAVKEYLLSFGHNSPLVFILLQIAQVLIAPIPGQIMGFAGGFIFGWKRGILYSMIGLAIGSFLAFYLSRTFGRPFVEKVIDKETLKRFDYFSTHKGPFALFMVFLLPFFPDDAICFIAGLTAIPLGRLMFIVIIGRFPWMLMLSLVGNGFAKEQILFPILLLSVVIGASALAWVYRKEIEDHYHKKSI